MTLRDELELCAPQLYRFACALVCGQAETCAKAADLVRAVYRHRSQSQMLGGPARTISAFASAGLARSFGRKPENGSL